MRGPVGTHIQDENDRTQVRGVHVLLIDLKLLSPDPACLQHTVYVYVGEYLKLKQEGLRMNEGEGRETLRDKVEPWCRIRIE